MPPKGEQRVGNQCKYGDAEHEWDQADAAFRSGRAIDGLKLDGQRVEKRKVEACDEEHVDEIREDLAAQEMPLDHGALTHAVFISDEDDEEDQEGGERGGKRRLHPDGMHRQDEADGRPHDGQGAVEVHVEELVAERQGGRCERLFKEACHRCCRDEPDR